MRAHAFRSTCKPKCSGIKRAEPEDNRGTLLSVFSFLLQFIELSRKDVRGKETVRAPADEGCAEELQIRAHPGPEGLHFQREVGDNGGGKTAGLSEGWNA